MPAAPVPLDRIGVGIDTARYGHRVWFLRPDRQPAAKPLTVLENHAGYQALQQRLEQLHQQHPHARFHVRIDAAGQYAANLEHFLRGLALPLTLSIGNAMAGMSPRLAEAAARNNSAVRLLDLDRELAAELGQPQDEFHRKVVRLPGRPGRRILLKLGTLRKRGSYCE